MGKLSILHLTDLHIGSGFIYDNPADLAIRICDEVESKDKTVDTVVVTGDIFNGKDILSQNSDKIIADANKLFRYLYERFKKKINPNITKKDFIFMPGNHDVKRDLIGDQFEAYRKFLKEFYENDDLLNELYDNEYLFVLRVYEKPKIAIVGLNSCKLEKDKVEASEIDWISSVNLESVNLEAGQNQKVKTTFTNALINKIESKWYDYGYIDSEQITAAFDLLDVKTNNDKDYTVIAAFHHHIHPFPEIYSKYGDATLIKNFEHIIQKLQKRKVRLVLHGHKHLPLIRPVANDNYLTNPDSLIYVVAGGNIGTKNLPQRHFNLLEVYDAQESKKIGRVSRFQFTGEKCDPIQEIVIPPDAADPLKIPPQKLLEILSLENNELYQFYLKSIYDLDITSREHGIDQLLDCIGNILTTFTELRENLNKHPEQVFYILLFAHLRTLSAHMKLGINNKHNVMRAFDAIVNTITSEAKQPSSFNKLLIDFLSKTFGEDPDRCYDKLNSFSSNSFQKRLSSLAVVTSFLTDLYLVLSRYADFEYEKINHKINIKLTTNTFHESIPSNHIMFHNDSERRAVLLSLKSKNPTSHKIAVMLIKEFEIELAKFENEFDELKLKVYYLIPKIQKESGTYQLEDYNFEAYIPTLLPLLIGRNLYKQKEVFIRELIQNSLDAIQLRKDLLKREHLEITFNDKIQISFGREDFSTNEDRSTPVQFLKIRDYGVGMDQAHVERYFIHIGRSFYDSHEYSEMVEKKQTTYKPISKFGIGFLSSFMVCREIRVKTRSYISDKDGLNIYIPNHEGCFFTNRDNSIINGSTEVILYEDPSNPLDFKEILKYIKDTILDIPLEIEIDGKINGVDFTKNIPAFALKTSLKNELDQPIFFVPFDDQGLRDFLWGKSSILDHPYGILFEVLWENKKEHKCYEMNGGILLHRGSEIKASKELKPIYSNIYINYPPSYLELDVSREKINKFKEISSSVSFDNPIFRQQIGKNVEKQAIEWTNSAKKTDFKVKVNHFLKMYHFLNNAVQIDAKKFLSEIYCLKISIQKNKFRFEFVPYKKDYFSPSNGLIWPKKLTEPIYIFDPRQALLLSQLLVPIIITHQFKILKNLPNAFNMNDAAAIGEFCSQYGMKVGAAFKRKAPEFARRINKISKEVVTLGEGLNKYFDESLSRLGEQAQDIFNSEDLNRYDDRYGLDDLLAGDIAKKFDKKFWMNYSGKTSDEFLKDIYDPHDKKYLKGRVFSRGVFYNHRIYHEWTHMIHTRFLGSANREKNLRLFERFLPINVQSISLLVGALYAQFPVKVADEAKSTLIVPVDYFMKDVLISISGAFDSDKEQNDLFAP